MLCSTLKSKESYIIFVYWPCRTSIYAKSSCDRIHFNDRSNNLAHYLCLCQWILSIKKCYRHFNMCYRINSDIFHLLRKLQSLRYWGIHSINCHLYWNWSHCCINVELWTSKLKCVHHDTVCRDNIFGSLYFCLCNG